MIAQFCTQCGAKLAADARFCSTCGTEIKQSVPQASTQPEGKRRLPLKRGPVPTPIILIIAGAIFLLVMGLLLLANSSRPASTTDAAAALPDSHNEEGIPYPEVSRISLAETKTRFDAGAALIVDVRSQQDYNSAHIPEAISLPLADLETRYRELPQNVEIITYCT